MLQYKGFFLFCLYSVEYQFQIGALRVYLVITESTSERSNWQPSICRFVVDAQTESCILGRLPDLLAFVCSTFYDELPLLTYIYSLCATNYIIRKYSGPQIEAYGNSQWLE